MQLYQQDTHARKYFPYVNRTTLVLLLTIQVFFSICQEFIKFIFLFGEKCEGTYLK